MTVEEAMKAKRLSLGLEQKDVAEATGVSRATICRAEAGKHRLHGANRDRVDAWLEEPAMADPDIEQIANAAIAHAREAIRQDVAGAGDPPADPPSDTTDRQFEDWAAAILARHPGEWVVPETYSMRAALDRLWVKDLSIEKWWVDGRNAYRLIVSPLRVNPSEGGENG